LTYTDATLNLTSATIDPAGMGTLVVNPGGYGGSNFLRIHSITDVRFQKPFLYYTFTANKVAGTFGVSAAPVGGTVPCLTNPVAGNFRIGYVVDTSTSHTIYAGSFSATNMGLNATDTDETGPHGIVRLYYN
jgi:hypothetical protein